MIAAITERLVSDYGFRAEGTHLRRGRCPECGRAELWTEAARPYVLFCSRLNKCGARLPVRSLYPELFNRFAERHPPSSADPHATASAYLRSRGLDPAPLLRAGVFAQGRRGVEGEDGTWQDYPTVRFPLAGGAACHRLIDYAGSDKNRFEGRYKGTVWALPGCEPSGEVWVTEGVIDALSLIQAGKQAVSVISAGHVPRAWLESLAQRRVKLILALDNDPAGRRGTTKLAEACRSLGLEHTLALPPFGRDWNDLLLYGELAPERIGETLGEAFWRGELAGAATAEAYYALWAARGRGSLFEFQGAYWRGRQVGKGEVEVRRLSDFTCEPRFALQRKVGAGRFEHNLRLRVRSQRRETEVNLEPRQLTN